jgi:hypothetical protein
MGRDASSALRCKLLAYCNLIAVESRRRLGLFITAPRFRPRRPLHQSEPSRAGNCGVLVGIRIYWQPGAVKLQGELLGFQFVQEMTPAEAMDLADELQAGALAAMDAGLDSVHGELQRIGEASRGLRS